MADKDQSNPPLLAVLLAVAVAVPLALAPGLAFFDITPKVLLILAGGGLALMLPWRAIPLPVAWLLGIQALAAMVSTVLAESPALALAGSDWRRLGLPAFLACLAIAAAASSLGSGDRRKVLAVVAGAGGLAALYAVAQFFGLDPIMDPKLYTIGEGEWAIRRAPSTFGHAGYLGVYLCYSSFAAWHLMRDGRRWLWGAVAVVSSFAILLTGSRGAWLGAAAGMILVLRDGTHRRKILIAALLVATAVGAFTLSPRGEPVRSRLRWFVEEPSGGGRLMLWRDSLRVSPWLGAGPDGYERVFPRRESEDLAADFPDRHFESPHNLLLDSLTTTGLAGAVTLLMLLGWTLRNYRGSPGLMAAALAGLVAQQFLAATIPTLLVCLLVALLSFVNDSERGLEVPRLWRAALGVVLLGLVVWPGSALVRADYALHQARQAAARGDLETMIRESRAAALDFPFAGVYPMAASRLMGNLGMNPQVPDSSRAYLLALALEEGQRALPASATPELVAVHVASVYAVQGRLADAETVLKKALAAAPNWYRPHYLYAELLSVKGLRAEASAEARRALDLGARVHPEIMVRCLGLLRNSS